MNLPEAISKQYALFPVTIVRVIALKRSFLVLVTGKESLKVHHWVYNHGWKLCKKC